jgi:hypothetical protein
MCPHTGDDCCDEPLCGERWVPAGVQFTTQFTTQFTCFAATQVQILTQKLRVILLFWYKSTKY